MSGLPSTSSFNLSSGNNGVNLLKSTLLASNSGSAPLTVLGSISAGYFSFCLGARIGPLTRSPLRILYFLITPAATYTSSSLGLYPLHLKNPYPSGNVSRIPSLTSPFLISLLPELTTAGASSSFDVLITSGVSSSIESKISSL